MSHKMTKCSQAGLVHPKQSDSLLVRVVLTVALTLALTGQIAVAQINPMRVMPGGTPHKIQVNDPALAKQIAAEGGRLLADYGSYQLYEVAQINANLSTNQQAELRDHYNVIHLNASPLDTTKPEIKAKRQAVGSFSGKRMHLVHFIGPVQPSWHDDLEAAGLKIISYIPENAYLVYGDAQSIAKVQGLAASAPHIQWEGAYADQYKLHPGTSTVDQNGLPRQIGTEYFAIQLVADADVNPATLQLLDQLKLEPINHQQYALHYLNVVARLSAADLQKVAAQPDVVSIHPYFPPKPLCERQDQIIAGNLFNNGPTGPGYLTWLASKGFTQAQFTASGFAVDVSDSGIDDGTTSPNHFGLHVAGNISAASRVAYNHLEGTANPGSSMRGCDGHGTLNAHIIGGYDNLSGFPYTDSSGFHYGLGVCPFVKVGSSVIFDPTSFTQPNPQTLQADAYNAGARISNNSWGAPGTDGSYDIDSQTEDVLVRDAEPSGSSHPAAGNQEMVIVFAAGNSGPNPQTVSSPATAKNVISVGAGENVQPFGGSDGSGIADSQADNANDIIFFSSRGPCTDGRHKPDIMAPGTHVSGGIAQTSSPGIDGTADACFTGTEVSGGVNSIFFPNGQQYYTASSGTSHSTPCVAGGCALLRQYFINNYSYAPSPAMTKAYLMNSARYMNGYAANDTLWSDSQGMGEMNLGFGFDGVPRILRDELATDMFTASGQIRTFTGTISNPGKPFRVTVAWTDAPGNTTGNAYNNNLDLTVKVGGIIYKGNVFSGDHSVGGGAADLKNNVESVFLPAGLSGGFIVTVAAANINSDGVPNNGNPLDQDFALVVYNGTPGGTASVVPTDSTLVSENCFPTNGIVDSGETVTFNFGLLNVGGGDTTNLVATLLATNGVLSPSGPQTYGVLKAGGAAASRPFTFTANVACGGTVIATLQLQDGSTNLGNVSFSIPVGKLNTTVFFNQNFDSVLAPFLPAGWTSTATLDQSPWTTTPIHSDNNSTNGVYVGDVPDPTIGELNSPVIAVPAAPAQLRFKNYYSLKTGTDGGVLEIKIGAGAFTDILTAGGTFVSGGYNAGLPNLATTKNPLRGRSAWSGDSGGFIPTVIQLPPAALGKTIQLKWRCGTDYGNGDLLGWFIDTISITTGNTYTCCTGLVAPSLQNFRVSGPNLLFSFQTIPGQTYEVETKSSYTNNNWTKLQSVAGNGSIVTVTNALSTPQSFYRVKSF
jgi:hypothetical protein